MTSASWFARPPQQRRTRAAAERVLAAAEGLLDDGGEDELTIQAVAARAGVSVGGIYRLFADKRALVRAVHSRVMDAVEADMLAVLEQSGPTVAETARALVDAATADIRRRAPAFRVFIGQAAGDPVMRERALGGVARIEAALAAALARDPIGLAHDDPAAAARFALALVLGTTMRGAGLAGMRTTGEWDSFVAELHRATLGYLAAPAP